MCRVHSKHALVGTASPCTQCHQRIPTVAADAECATRLVGAVCESAITEQLQMTGRQVMSLVTGRQQKGL